MKLVNVEQGSQEWLDTRLGIPTASNFGKIVTSTGTKSSQYKTYMNELIAERLGVTSDSFKSDWMDRGNEIEPQARSTYEFIKECEAKEVGIMLTDDGRIGASPDGLIGLDGGIEIKCPKASTMVGYLLNNKLPTTYKPQVQGNLWVSGRKWWDFMSYHPQLEPFILRIYRDEEYIAKLDKYITGFIDELDEKYKRLQNAK